MQQQDVMSIHFKEDCYKILMLKYYNTSNSVHTVVVNSKYHICLVTGTFLYQKAMFINILDQEFNKN